MISTFLYLLCFLFLPAQAHQTNPLRSTEVLNNNAILSQTVINQVTQERRMSDLKIVLEENLPFTVSINGLFRTAIYGDTRQVFGELDNYENFLPAQSALDANGVDVNKRGQQNIVPSDSRFVMTVLGPETWGANTWGLLESDFLGVGNSIDFEPTNEFSGEESLPVLPILNRLLRNEIANRFNIRRLFFRLDWENHSLLFGQEFHPFVRISAPEVLNFNTGAPFAADSRSCQIRLTIHRDQFEMILALISERQFLHDGPRGPSSEYYRNSLTPILNTQLRYYFDNHMIGGGINYNRLTPRLLSLTRPAAPIDENFRDYSSLSSINATAYADFHFRHFTFHTKLNYLENAANFQLLGGYAVHTRDPITDRRTYTNLRAFTIWNELVITKKIEPALFFAYGKNLGARKSIITTRFVTNDLVYSLFPNVDQAWRISPRIRFRNEPIVIGFEIEYTGAIYGDLDDCGKIINKQPSVHNVRLLALFDYYF